MKLFKTCIQHEKSIEWIYAIADNGNNAIKKIIKNRFNDIKGIDTSLERQKNQVKINLKEVTEEVDWIWENKQ